MQCSSLVTEGHLTQLAENSSLMDLQKTALSWTCRKQLSHSTCRKQLSHSTCRKQLSHSTCRKQLSHGLAENSSPIHLIEGKTSLTRSTHSCRRDVLVFQGQCISQQCEEGGANISVVEKGKEEQHWKCGQVQG